MTAAVVCALCVSLSAQETPFGGNAWTPAILESEDTWLPDFSYAGYHRGESPLPSLQPTHDVSDFGAEPDDGLDDTAAFKAALAAADEADGRVVLGIPPGRFLLSEILYLERDSLVLQGAGSGENGTELHFARAMRDMAYPEPMLELKEYLVAGNKRVKSTGELFSPFSWTGGVLWVRKPGARLNAYLPNYDRPEKNLTAAVSGRRGGHLLEVDDSSSLRPGGLVAINWFNRDGDDGEFLSHLYMSDSVVVGSRHWEHPERPLVTQIATVTRIIGNRLELGEPLLHDIKPAWQGTLTRPSLLTEVGIEGLRITFPDEPYRGHHLEAGANAIYLTNLAHGWVRDVKIENADNPILSDNSAFVTLADIETAGRKGHYGIHIGKVNHFLVAGATIGTDSEHALSMNTGAKASVFTGCRVLRTPTLDQHCGANHQNLFDNLEIVEENPQSDLFKHGGAGYWRPTHGAYNTIWNLRISYRFAAPVPEIVQIDGPSDGPSARIVGIAANLPVALNYGPSAWIEGVNRPGIGVPSLYIYQLERRLAKRGSD